MTKKSRRGGSRRRTESRGAKDSRECRGGCEEFEADENRWFKNAFRTSSRDVLFLETTSSIVCFREIAPANRRKILK